MSETCASHNEIPCKTKHGNDDYRPHFQPDGTSWIMLGPDETWRAHSSNSKWKKVDTQYDLKWTWSELRDLWIARANSDKGQGSTKLGVSIINQLNPNSPMNFSVAMWFEMSLATTPICRRRSSITLASSSSYLKMRKWW